VRGAETLGLVTGPEGGEEEKTLGLVETGKRRGEEKRRPLLASLCPSLGL